MTWLPATRSRAEEVAGRAKGATSTAPARVRSQAGSNPLVLGVLAFGAGVLAATFLPETEREKEAVDALQPKVEGLAEDAAASAREAVDELKPKVGEAVFKENCARCHGTYGTDWTYPNKVIPLDEVGTDRKRYENIGPEFGKA